MLVVVVTVEERMISSVARWWWSPHGDGHDCGDGTVTIAADHCHWGRRLEAFGWREALVGNFGKRGMKKGKEK